MRRFMHCAAMMLLTGFLLGIHQGKVALWPEGSERPEQIYDIRADSLPPADRLALKRGIPLHSREALWEILEDYLE